MNIIESSVLSLIADIERNVMSAQHPDRPHQAQRACEQLHGITLLLIRSCGGQSESDRVIDELIAAQDRIIEAVASSHRIPLRNASRHSASAGVLR